MSREGWEAVIGVEVHAQLRTQSKAFSSAGVAYGAPPNSLVNEVCSGQPGALPVLNRAAVEQAVRAGLALGSTVHPVSQFARKNYFYPDLPKGYQISQYDRPLCTGGELRFEVGDDVRVCRLERVHMEEDTGQSHHEGDERVSRIDLNRAGTPLIEIVSMPDLRTGEEAAAYFRELRAILVAIGVNDGNLAEGSMRCDANVSVRRVGDPKLGTKVEIKNINSFRYVRDAIEHEIDRQIAALEAGERLWQETRLWNEVARRTVLMRRKEGSSDYRYFPEPDLPLLVVDAAEIEALRASLPELPAQSRARLQEVLGLSAYDAGVVVANDGFLATLDSAVAAGANAKAVVNWLTGSVAAAVNAGALEWKAAGARFETPAGVAIGAPELVALQALVDAKTVSIGLARAQVWEKLLETGDSPATIVEREGLKTTGDSDVIDAAIRDVMAANPGEVEKYRGGKVTLMGFFVGQVMRAMRGKADAAVVNERVKALLDGGGS
jgi:aspartyl-tRNA(Asn)/glutamyl-tRNA(Gln) amidotransferase subunit B